MSTPEPIYTAENCKFSCPLEWGLSVFWRFDQNDAPWYTDLATAVEADGIRLLGHRFTKPGVSQFAISTLPYVAPLTIVQRVKGRLQHLVRDQLPNKPLQRNYAIRSFGRVTRKTIEHYVATQLDHHRMADPRVQQRLANYQIKRDVDLSQARQTSHGLYWYNLHVVFVHRERWTEIRDDVLGRLREMIVGACDTKGWLLSRAGILADHVHVVVGCTLDVSPLDVGLSSLNNLAYVHGMRPVYQFGGFLGTIGEYDQRAVKSDDVPPDSSSV